MRINRRLLFLLILCSSISAFGQSGCVKKDFIGRWREVAGMAGNQSANVDSLKEVAENSFGDFAALTIFADDKYTYRWGDELDDKKRKEYRFDLKSCQVILRGNRRTADQSNIEITYLDGKYLIYIENNYPRGYWTHLLSECKHYRQWAINGWTPVGILVQVCSYAKKNRTMKECIFLAFAVISLNVSGQGHFLGARTGVSLTNILSSNSTIAHGSRVGFSGGLSYDYLFRDKVLIGADIIFNQRGFTNDFIVEDGFGNPTGGIITTKYEYDYLSFPVRAGTYFGKKAFGFGQIGVMPSILVQARTIPGSDAPSMGPAVTTFDFAGIVELGAGYKLNRYWLSLSAFYQHSFTKFTDFYNFGDTNFRHKGLTLSLGLKYQLRKA